ncbi:RmlC-like cupin domain-containing protein [Desarmillaria tabescens]|uniref:homogentisate 1,2-dioxygenase n=1 Tax=Armillaria tabescens TaxID=1929756 RepID=A0AA39T7P7_ARMTA|nr:RmlC-like cupin domain-containing protein [Desarmillaria tabescens]KAK0470186.1 RmlC-like cupin domain-containing protein [Desarmillaria tabescens]
MGWPSPASIKEIFGSHFELPDLGPIGGHGMANPRDFEVPLASFEIDETSWEVVYKIGGQLFSAAQDHMPFDMVAWQGNPSKDHIDPSVFTVLTAKSKAPGIPLVNVLVFAERWNVATDTFRPPYYHRNNATEITVFCPHGQKRLLTLIDLLAPPEVHKAASVVELKPERTTKDSIGILSETPMVLTMTDYAMNRAGTVAESEPLSFPPDFIAHLDEINADLKAAGYEELKKRSD